jgi:hypothetical protein
MFISSIRWRAASVVITAGAAAAAVLALTVPAGAVTGTAEISPEQAGYTATGAQFKEIDASVFLRQPGQYAGEVGQYSHSVQLWSSGVVAVVGVRASTSGSSYTPYSTIYDRSTHQVIASNPNAEFCFPDGLGCSTTIQSFPAGDTVTLSIHYVPTEGGLQFFADDEEPVPPGELDTGTFTSFAPTTPGPGVSVTQARVGTEFGSDPWTAPSSYTPPANFTKVAAYIDVALTTYNGHTSTLWSWWVHHKLLANTEQQSSADWVAIPADLTLGGASFQTFFVPQSAQGPDQPVLH